MMSQQRASMETRHKDMLSSEGVAAAEAGTIGKDDTGTVNKGRKYKNREDSEPE